MNQKLQWLRNKMSSLDMQGIIISNPINIKYLTNIDVINSTKIQKLYIERCSKIKDLSFLEGNCNLNDVFIDNVESIRFVPSLFNLEKFRFWNCIDGDLKPLLSNNHLIYIYFYPNKRHYTHSLNEILDAKNNI